MPKISEFYGIVVYMYVLEQHGKPHIHAKCGGDKASVDIATGEFLVGRLPSAQTKTLAKWMKMHRDELLADWELAMRGEHPKQIEPLK